MRHVATASCLALLALTIACQGTAAPEVLPGAPTEPALDPDGWVSLFDGESLDGWTPKIRGHAAGEDPYGTFQVRDGMIQVGYDGYEGTFDGRFGHLFHEVPFSRYRIRVEYRFVGEQMAGGPGWAWRNSGIMLHGQTPESMAVGQEFPVSIEMQLLGGPEQGKRTNANLCTPGTNVVMGDKLDQRHCINSTSATCPGDDWYTVTVEVQAGEAIRHYLGDDLVLEYTEPQLDPRDSEAQLLIEGDELLLTAGTISLQSESHPIHFRKVEIQPLD